MLHLIATHINRWLPQTGPLEDAPAWIREDSSWHNSSFELARGLDVFELAGPVTAGFADTLPAFHPPKS